MNDLISRQAALDALGERCESECEYSKKQRSVMCDACYLGSAKEVIEEVPTIDPVKHGKWKPFDLTWGRSVYACTNCGEAFEVPTEIGNPIYTYCPNCGARMDL